MSHSLSARFWIESIFALITAMLAGVSAIWPDWIEGTTGLEPDGGSGLTEWLIVFALLVLTAVLIFDAGRAYRRIDDVSDQRVGSREAASKGLEFPVVEFK